MPDVRLCVTVTAATTAELRERRDQAVDADLVELRLDTVGDPSAEGALAGRRRPVIVTCRPTWEGGRFTGSEEERRRLLAEAQRLGADYVDVEWKAGFTDIVARNHGRGVIVSHHDFRGVPGDLADRARAMRATGAEVVKLAVMAERLTDCLVVRAVRGAAGAPAVLLAMGDAGVASRLLPERFGSCWTYAGNMAAPGQLPAARLRHEFSFGSVGARAAVYGVVGRPVLQSLSPAMHNAQFRASGIDAVYLPLEARDFDDFLAFAEAMNLQGASVTAPYKRAAFDRAVERDGVSTRVEAANTLTRAGGGWSARNTDVAGFLEPLEAAIALRDVRATILGAGGAARAAAHALASAGARVSIAARRRPEAEAAARIIGADVQAWPPAADSWDLLVNATPCGAAPGVEGSPLPGGPFRGRLVYDLVYDPPDTRLLRDARDAGCRTLGGLDMLVAQARHQFQWWTGRPASADVMRSAAERALDVRGGASPVPAGRVPGLDQP
jgi:3-dehydroquinate dehydratase/shikimate dehydrogenase